jgi:hypothetical protein
MKKILISILLSVLIIFMWVYLAGLNLDLTFGFSKSSPLGISFTQNRSSQTMIPFQIETGDCTDTGCNSKPIPLGYVFSIASWVILFLGIYFFKRMPKYLKVIFILYIIVIPFISNLYSVPYTISNYGPFE